MLLLAAVLAAGALAGCQAEGSVRVVIDEPEVLALSPLDPRLATISLTVETPGLPAQVFGGNATSRDPLPLGDFKVSEGATFTLEGRAAGGRLVGFGRVLEPVEISASEETVVRIPFRRPYAYVATGNELVALNTAVDTSEGLETVAWSSPETNAVAPTPDGLDVLVASNGRVILLDTSTHAPRGGSATAGDVSALAIAPDGRHAALLHTEEPRGVTIIDLTALRAGGGDAATFFVPLDNVVALDVSDTRAWVLQNDLRTCLVESSLRSLGFEEGVPVETARPLGGCVTSIDVAPDGGRVALGMAGRGLVLRDLDGDAEADVVVALDRPTAVTISAGRAFGIGTTSGVDGARVVVASVALDGSDPLELTLPVDAIAPTYELATGSGQTVSLTRSLAADDVVAIDVSAMPDGSAIAVFTATTFHADPETVSIPTTGGDVLVDLDSVDVSTADYLLLDARQGILVQAARTSCRLADPAPARDCGITTPTRFTALRGAILYGDR